MKIWLASYPRSGNTFLRNVLFQCYGIESSTYHHETTYALEDDYDTFEIVKTHLLPEELPEQYQNLPKVYLIRDGRDAVVSMAHHKKDLIDIGTLFEDNLQEIIIAANGTHFGGWSKNVMQWIKAADIIIRYEDLIVDPIKEIEKIRAIYPLPEPDRSKVPSFNQLKEGNANYGSGKFHNLTGEDEKTFSQKNFRKGKAGGWKDEMTDYYHDLFWNYHGTAMLKMGYLYDGNYSPVNELSMSKIQQKITAKSNSTITTYKILIDASKILGTTTDGVKRYVVELLRALKEIQELGNKQFHFHIYLNGKIFDIEEVDLFIDQPINNTKEFYWYENILLGIRKIIKWLFPSFIYDKFSPYYRNSNIREKLLLLRERVSQDQFYRKVLNKKKEENVFNNYDLLHITLPQHLPLFGDHTIKTVVTVHDVSHQTHPEYHLENNRLLAEKGFQLLVDKKYPIISVSNSTTHELKASYPLFDTSVTTIYEAVNTDLFKYNINLHLLNEVLLRYNIPLNKKYFLCLSTLEPRKNIISTIKAFIEFKKLDSECILVIAGQRGWKYDELFSSDLIHDSIYFTGFIRDRDLSALYSAAIAFCYVSHYEGFGLPILEAMSCRTPVICGSNSSQVELLGNGGIAVNSNNIEAIKNAMQELSKPEVRENYAQKAWKQSFAFNWFHVANQSLYLYKHLIENN